MEWNKIEEVIRDIVLDIKKECIIQNTAIRDDIFGILENYCAVIYYPLPDEKNRGFHIKKIVKNKLVDFVYINSDKPMAEQIFAAAHEFGHIWAVAEKVWKKMQYEGLPTEEEEEDITNRFAAELLMPAKEFRMAFIAHMRELGIKPGYIRLEDVIRLIVLQMNDFMVPYEAVRKRLVETKIMSPEGANSLLLKEAEILQMVSIYTKDQNTYLGKGTGAKTIPGLRALIAIAESEEKVDDYLLNKIKKDFDIIDMPVAEKEIEIRIEDSEDE